MAEDAVLSLFLARGYSLLARNYTVHNAGELDLILTREMCIYIVEVKCRSERDSFGGAAAAVTGQKKLKMIRTARVFLQRWEWQQYDVRFLAGCVTHRDGTIVRIEILPM
jgi:Holliday junction resolvase-like predicted endonuclease